jgi:hypothetical protein
VTHSQLVEVAVRWLRGYGCGVILSEQECASGETPDAIGWKKQCRSVLVECKVDRADFLADRNKRWRMKSATGLGCERFYMATPGLIKPNELPCGWGLLLCNRRNVQVEVPSADRNLRSAQGLKLEMNLLLASLRRVEIRIEPQTITEFLQWKNRLVQYNGGIHPRELVPASSETNQHLSDLS